jgi:putative hydrolase of the HAD superfamily
MLNVDDLIRSCQAVVFDCADTLLRLDPSREVIFRDAAAEAGLELQLDDVARAYELVDFAVKIKSSELGSGAVKSEFYRAYNTALCAALGIVQSMGALNSVLIHRFSERRHWVAFEDAADTLRAIGERVPVHVLANWDNGLEDVIRQAGLRELVHDVAASAALGAEKPDRACFDAFLTRNALDPTRTLYVGNEYIADVVGAREAGLTPVLIDRKNRLPAADCWRIRALADLIPPFSMRSSMPEQRSISRELR